MAGTVVSGLALGTASVIATGLALKAPPEATSPDVPPGSEFNQSREDRAARLPEPEDSPDAASAPRVDPPSPDDLAGVSAADTAPAAQPETGPAEERLAPPATAADDAPGVEASRRDAPPAQGTGGAAPPVPEPETGLPDVAAPADQPETGQEGEGALATPGAGEAKSGVEASSAADTPPASGTRGDAPAAPAEDAGVDVSTAPAAQPRTGAAEDAMPAPETGTAEPGVVVEDDSPVLPSPQAMPPEAPGAESDLSISTEPAQPVQPEITEEDSAFPGSGGGADRGAQASGTIADLAPEVTTDRLPSLREAPGDDSAAAPSARPLDRFAVPFENPEGKPLMSIVLIDDGASPVGLDALGSFPYPVSFAIDASWPGAAAAAREYRDAGFEVLALTNLPPGAGPRDTEVAMQGLLGAVPGAVAVIEGTGTGLQENRAAAEQLAPILLDSGHGLVLLPQGLNTVRKLAERQGVPAATVFRDFDSKGQDATVIRRFLDQAAFRAGQEDGGVIMLGRLRAETVSALILWGLQDRASRVALAPVSAILRQD